MIAYDLFEGVDVYFSEEYAWRKHLEFLERWDCYLADDAGRPASWRR